MGKKVDELLVEAARDLRDGKVRKWVQVTVGIVQTLHLSRIVGPRYGHHSFIDTLPTIGEELVACAVIDLLLKHRQHSYSLPRSAKL